MSLEDRPQANPEDNENLNSASRPAGYPPPSNEAVQGHKDFQEKAFYMTLLDKVERVNPDFKPDLGKNIVLAMETLRTLDETGKFIDPEYSIASEPAEKLAEMLQKEMPVGEEIEQEDVGDRDNILLGHIKQGMKADYPNLGLKFGKDYISLLKNSDELQAKIKPYLADMGIELANNEIYKFSDELGEAIDQIQINIDALDTMAQASPVYAAKVEAANIDVTNRAAVQSFVLTSGFLEDDSIDETSKDEIIQKLDLPDPRVKTGGQVDRTLNTRGADGKPLYTSQNPVDIGNDTQGFVYPNGDRAVRVTLPDGRSRDIPLSLNESDTVIGLKISLVRIWAVNEWDGQTDFFGESVDIENDILSQTDPQKLTKVQNMINAILGGTRGYDGVIVQDDEAAFIGWFNQFLAIKGDAAQGDFDKTTAGTNRINLGLHPNGNLDEIDYDVLRAAALYAKGQYGTGTPDYFALQRHLHDLFPEKNIPLTGENAPDETSPK